MEKVYYIGVDVGTASARAAFVDANDGTVAGVEVEPITVHNPAVGYYQQSSSEIWSAVCTCVRRLSRKLLVQQQQDDQEQLLLPKIGGIGFDATCSLVVVVEDGGSCSVDPSGQEPFDVIMWMDHRAGSETEEINRKDHKAVLDSVGGSMSIEMQVPKLMWLKRHRAELWDRAAAFFDLPDFLTWKAVGSPPAKAASRSRCSLTCKWTYNSNEVIGGWSGHFFEEVGLGDLAREDFIRIGRDVKSPGDLCGFLDEDQAEAMGLPAEVLRRSSGRIPVAVSLIDAHAGSLGMLALKGRGVEAGIDKRLGLIAGTSSCHMIMKMTMRPAVVAGVWGPYDSAILPGWWLHEGGQSAVGSLLDYVVDSHPASASARAEAAAAGTTSVFDHLNGILLADERASAEAASGIHYWPDFHGNRSPLGDPALRGMVCGLSLDRSVRNLALNYLACVQSICYGTRHIVQSLEQDGGHSIEAVTLTGGLSKNDLFAQCLADVLGVPVLRHPDADMVLLGSAMLAASAAALVANDESGQQGLFDGGQDRRLISVAERWTIEEDVEVLRPRSCPETSGYHDKKFRVFLAMVEDQRKYARMMSLQ